MMRLGCENVCSDVWEFARYDARRSHAPAPDDGDELDRSLCGSAETHLLVVSSNGATTASLLVIVLTAAERREPERRHILILKSDSSELPSSSKSVPASRSSLRGVERRRGNEAYRKHERVFDFSIARPELLVRFSSSRTMSA